GYAPRYRDLAARIRAAVSNADVDGKPGRRSSFEVTINNVLIYSKIKTDTFP
ncbi:hypothetical protein CAPTEDRAFT_153402, partial [Capitella teleta]